MSLSDWLTKYKDARISLRNGKSDQAANLAAPLLETLLRHLIFDNLKLLDLRLRAQILQREQEAKRSHKGTGFNFLANLYRDLPIFTALQNATGRSTLVLETLNLNACRRIRNKTSHGDPVTADEARLLLNTIEYFLAYLGVDVESAQDDAELAPLRFSNIDDCLILLLLKVWKFPDIGGTHSSWAVKESGVLRGDIDHAMEHPGLGIALFTTELAVDVFGKKAVPKIRACVDWAVSRTTVSSQYLISEEMIDTITGKITNKSDFRHTIALAILMARADALNDHQKLYLELVLNNACNDGGWPAVLGNAESDLTATVYAVEYLATSSKSLVTVSQDLRTILRLGQEWLILTTTSGGGWETGIFSGKSWDRLWSTAYLLQRLLSIKIPAFPEWSEALTEAVAVLLHDALIAEYKDSLLQLRVEARVAAALAVALQADIMPLLMRGSTESWLHDWERRSINTLRHLPSKECDLATATFIARALLYGKDYGEIGRSVLAIGT